MSSPNAPEAAPDWLTIVGVAPAIRQRARPDADPVVYLPYPAAPPLTAWLLVRSRSESAALASLLRDEVLALDTNLPLYRVQTMAPVVDEAQWNGRVSSALLHVLTCIALGLSTVGLYAVTAHAVSRRTREIGLRMALGARPHQVRWLILRRAMAQIALGFLAGIACTVAWDRIFSSGRAGVRMTDPQSLAIVAAALVVVAVMACLVPVRRATRLDPVAAIRHD